MKVLSIHPETQTVKEIEIEMQANTVYTFFSSISIDEFTTLKEHTIYTDENALSKNKIPFFIGEQLVIGDALIIGIVSQEECDATIPIEELNMLISYDLSQFYKDAIRILNTADINLYRVFNVEKSNEKIELNTEWVLYTFNIADEKTKEYFLSELQKSVDNKLNIKEFISKMAQLAINAS